MDSEGSTDQSLISKLFVGIFRTQWIEALPNEVLVSFIVIGFAMAYLVRSTLDYLGLSNMFSSSNAIHQDAEDAVDSTRRRLFGASSANPARTNRANSPDATCPICLGQPIRLPVETNCGHAFCGRCFVTFCAYEAPMNLINPARCPVCRQRVTLLLPGFGLEEAAALSPEDQRAVLHPLARYNRRFSGEPRSWREQIADLPTLMRHLLTALFSESGLALMLRLRVLIILAIAGLYLLSPIDLLPESVLGVFGLLDDLFIFFLLAIYVSMIYRRFAAENPQFLGPGIEEPAAY